MVFYGIHLLNLLVNRKKNICIFGNVITLQIILRNEIPGNNNLFKVTDTKNKVWLMFVFKGTPEYKNKSNTMG